MVYSLIFLGFMSFIVWAHHMFMTGMGTTMAAFFQTTTMIISIPSVVILTALVISLWGGSIRFNTPMLFAVGFLPMFGIGGLTGLPLGLAPSDIHLHDTYYVIGHFHYVVAPGTIFALFAGVYYWFPKVTGRMYDERLAQVSFWLSFVGTTLTFFPMHIVGLLGMTRRVYTYHSGFGWDVYNFVETVGAFILAAGLLIIFANLFWSRFRGAPSGPDPFYGGTLEWTTSSPPPPYNFAVIPTVSSPYPNWDRVEAGLALDHGHETVTTTVRDGRLDDVVTMPAESGWPIVLAFAVTLVFIMLLTSHPVVAGIFAGLAGLVLVAWHVHEPAEG
jgi:heme/copper-type cytochrome/quinol oxidase subunit 1